MIDTSLFDFEVVCQKLSSEYLWLERDILGLNIAGVPSNTLKGQRSDTGELLRIMLDNSKHRRSYTYLVPVCDSRGREGYVTQHFLIPFTNTHLVNYLRENLEDFKTDLSSFYHAAHEDNPTSVGYWNFNITPQDILKTFMPPFASIVDEQNNRGNQVIELVPKKELWYKIYSWLEYEIVEIEAFEDKKPRIFHLHNGMVIKETNHEFKYAKVGRILPLSLVEVA